MIKEAVHYLFVLVFYKAKVKLQQEQFYIMLDN